jgi:hypothetical protein
MAELILPEDGLILVDHPAHTVFTRERWSDEWEEVEFLYARRLYFATGTTMGAAELEWRFGIGMRAGEETFGEHEEQELLDYYVKVEIDQGEGEDPWVWTGVIAVSSQNPRGGALLGAGDQWVITGQQQLTAYTLDLLLERMEVNRSYVKEAGTTLEFSIGRGLTFNQPNDYADEGNRTAAKGGQGAYLFAEDLGSSSSVAYWRTIDILEYLLIYAAQESSGFITWKLGDKAKAMLPDWDRPILETDRRSIRSLIDQLCDRRRLLTWWIEVDDEDNVLLQAASFAKEDLDLPHGGTQAANANQIHIDVGRAVDARATLTDTADHRVDQVVVRGHWCTSTFTLSPADDTLGADWTAAAQTQYNAGPAGIGELDIFEAERRVREWRAQDRFARVYSYFRLPADFDYQVGDGQGGEKVSVFPDEEETDLDFVGLYRPEFRLLPAIRPGLFGDQPTNSPSEPPRPIALIKVKDSPDPEQWQHVDRLAAASETEGEGDGSGRDFSCSVRIRDDVCGVIVRVSGGPGIAQHAIASAGFVPIDDIDLPEDAIYNWATLVVTATAELDTRLTVPYPETPDPDIDCQRTMFVDVGEYGRLDWVTENTVIGAENGALQYAGPGYFLRDDREWMEDLARFVWEWYSVPRQAFQLHLQQVIDLVDLGDLITNIGADDDEEETNALVTAIDVDLDEGTTKITTSFAELDPQELAGLAVPDYDARRMGGNPFDPAPSGLGHEDFETMLHGSPYLRPPQGPAFETMLRTSPFPAPPPPAGPNNAIAGRQGPTMEELLADNPFS